MIILQLLLNKTVPNPIQEMKLSLELEVSPLRHTHNMKRVQSYCVFHMKQCV